MGATEWVRPGSGQGLVEWAWPEGGQDLLWWYQRRFSVWQGHGLWTLPMCLLVSSTAAFLLTLDNSPKQKRSELDGSVKPSTVMEGCEAWKVSPTRWFNS